MGAMKGLDPEQRARLKEKLGKLAAKRANAIGKARKERNEAVWVARETYQDVVDKIWEEYREKRAKAIKNATRKPRAKKS